VTLPGGGGDADRSGHAGGDDLAELIAAMDPELDDTTYVVVTGPHDLDPRPLAPLVTVVEDEGTTAVIDEQRLPEALALGCTPEHPPPMSRITLRVHSSLLAVGLTAAVSGALAGRGISCNVVAGYFHDHLLVPVERGSDALEVLRSLQGGTRT
jgi:hypothetical protein